MQMTDFSTADLYQPNSANNWYQSQFSTLGNSFSSFNNNLNPNNSSGHSQINSISQLHHSSSLDSVTNTLLHNSPPNSTSPQQPQSQNQLTSNNLSQTTSNNHFSHQLLSPIQQPQSLQQNRLNSNTIPLNSSNSTSTNNNLNNLSTSNNTLSTFNPHSSTANTVAAVAAAAAHLNHSHQFNLPPNLNVTAVHSAQHSTHSQFAHPLTAHHPHQHPLNHLSAVSAHHHHSFLNAASNSNNFFHPNNNLTGSNLTPTSSFPTPPSPSSPTNNSSIHTTTNAFNNLSFSTGHNSNNTGNAMNAVVAMAAMSRTNGSLSSDNNQINAHNSLSNYERMHAGYSPFTDNNSALGHSYSLIEHHSNRPSGLDSFVGLRHMSSTLTNLTSNCNTVNSSANLLMNGNSLNNSTVNNMFLPNHNSTDPNSISQSNLMANHLNSSLANSSMLNNSNPNNLIAAHNNAHNNSINSNSDNSSRHNAEEDLTIVGIKQEDEDEQSMANNNFNNSINNSTHPMSFDWIKKSQHNIQAQSGKTRTRDKYRVVYSELQRVELEKEFLHSKYITIKKKSELAQALSLSERQVKIWFQNRRAKDRKNDKKKEVNDCYKGPALIL